MHSVYFQTHIHIELQKYSALQIHYDSTVSNTFIICSYCMFIYIIFIIKIWNKEKKVSITTVFVRGIMLILPVNVAVEVCLHNRSLEHCHQHKAYISLMDTWTRKQNKAKQNKHTCNKKAGE